jgi:hypothetical protein
MDLHPLYVLSCLTTRILEDIQVHDGFQKTFERTADGMLEGVRSALASTGVSKVLVTGHSLGIDSITCGSV